MLLLLLSISTSSLSNASKSSVTPFCMDHIVYPYTELTIVNRVVPNCVCNCVSKLDLFVLSRVCTYDNVLCRFRFFGLRRRRRLLWCRVYEYLFMFWDQKVHTWCRTLSRPRINKDPLRNWHWTMCRALLITIDRFRVFLWFPRRNQNCYHL